MAEPTYATVEDLQTAADYQPSAYEADRLLRLVDAASRRVEQQLHRHFYPVTAQYSYIRSEITKPRATTTSGIWLERDLLSVSAVTADSVAQTVGDLELWPPQFGPPYSWLGITGSDIAITGDWGYSNDTAPAGALAEALDATETGVDVTNSAAVGIGDLAIVDSERMTVTAKTQLDVGQNIQGNLTADTSNTTVPVEDGTTLYVGESMLVNAEKMLIQDISANNLTVKRAWDGSVLAAHTSGDDIYAPRTLTVERGAAGSTAATHLTAAALTKNVPPGPIRELCIAEALNAYEQETSGYARTIGAGGENVREARGFSLSDARNTAQAYRRVRVGAI
jgi:hypothetical protein